MICNLSSEEIMVACDWMEERVGMPYELRLLMHEIAEPKRKVMFKLNDWVLVFCTEMKPYGNFRLERSAVSRLSFGVLCEIDWRQLAVDRFFGGHDILVLPRPSEIAAIGAEFFEHGWTAATLVLSHILLDRFFAVDGKSRLWITCNDKLSFRQVGVMSVVSSSTTYALSLDHLGCNLSCDYSAFTTNDSWRLAVGDKAFETLENDQ